MINVNMYNCIIYYYISSINRSLCAPLSLLPILSCSLFFPSFVSHSIFILYPLRFSSLYS